ncbi:class I SAM-dependent methyltransferase [Luteibacter aegosomatissinici]|uniref:class I SAM-dependent methyltransferase n=1 Tax=Luteibacter aegosomatissinici TaxID=2911539 RepID=UPI001FF8D0C4|nr:class I SAM-dependent methyltransferase [Luteibacter aegosomatissinici]UPG95186.1 methyltransferase domain-containing protein [Luteibacter aegosomatissinici]
MFAAPVLDPAPAYALWAASYPAHAHNPLMQAEERAMLALMPTRLDGLHVVDAGCGSGRYLRHAMQRGAMTLVGVDLSAPMLTRAAALFDDAPPGARMALAQGDLAALPLPEGSADLLLCGLAVGHVVDLASVLYEFARVSRPGATLVISDFHPVGAALGWQRNFQAGGQRYAVRHTTHYYSHWHAACLRAGLVIDAVAEPMLDPADIPAGARFDPVALDVPVALVMRLRRLAT